MAARSTSRSLHDLGWRQGSVFEGQLTTLVQVLSGGRPIHEERSANVWVVASQDCDLDLATEDAAEAVVEVRPVREGGSIPDWGIRSRRLRLDDRCWIEASDPRVMVSPELLASLTSHRREPGITGPRAKALKSWLGLRYDRPAVPPEFLELAQSIAQAVRTTRTPELTDQCHDILMQFSPGHPPRFALWAVTVEDADQNAFTEWMATVGLQVPESLGVLAELPMIVTKARLSLDVIENSFAADLSALTWGRDKSDG